MNPNRYSIIPLDRVTCRAKRFQKRVDQLTESVRASNTTSTLQPTYANRYGGDMISLNASKTPTEATLRNTLAGHQTPRMPQELILLLLDILAPRAEANSFSSSSTRDISTLKAIRRYVLTKLPLLAVDTIHRANKEFSLLCEKYIFYKVAIGKSYVSGRQPLPEGILEHTRFISLYAYAFAACTGVWKQIADAKNIVGIFCVPSASWPFWYHFRSHLLPLQNRIVHITLCLGTPSFSEQSLYGFEAAIADLSKTVQSATFDLCLTNCYGLSALHSAKRIFDRLTSVEFRGLEGLRGAIVLNSDWACRNSLKRLRFHQCLLNFRDELSQFLASMHNVTQLELDGCHPFSGFNRRKDELNILYIKKGRKFEVFDLQVFHLSHWCDPILPVHITIVEVDNPRWDPESNEIIV
jgi:hypothetical protein